MKMIDHELYQHLKRM